MRAGTIAEHSGSAISLRVRLTAAWRTLDETDHCRVDLRVEACWEPGAQIVRLPAHRTPGRQGDDARVTGDLRLTGLAPDSVVCASATAPTMSQNARGVRPVRAATNRRLREDRSAGSAMLAAWRSTCSSTRSVSASTKPWPVPPRPSGPASGACGSTTIWPARCMGGTASLSAGRRSLPSPPVFPASWWGRSCSTWRTGQQGRSRSWPPLFRSSVAGDCYSAWAPAGDATPPTPPSRRRWGVWSLAMLAGGRR